MSYFSLAAPLLSLILIQSASTSSSVSAFTLQNVTINPTDPSIKYYPTCNDGSQEACAGAWWEDSSNPNYYNGTAVVCGDATGKYNDVDPYLAYSFTGSAIYVYQWLSSDTAAQANHFNNNEDYFFNYTKDPSQYVPNALSSTPQLFLAYSLTNLNPTEEHTVSIQHMGRPDGTNSFIRLDHLVVTQTVGEIPKGPSKLSDGAKLGIAICSIIVGMMVLVGAICFRSRIRMRRKEVEDEKKMRVLMGVDGDQSTGAGSSFQLKWMNSSDAASATQDGTKADVQQKGMV
ncbi:hypothetical protein FRB94_001652 [Tulasnella sp. JGI-2019a]|nr:hypothetical protein FRB94_001652 [Tulasnella sp. JGI-2019a]KAG9010426.1 hypothetical protein FRB93_004266 [Tulasnella sp. JGI-2019a]KAG9038718.1 hypothetical protein FRB95_000308 [Tulasnella sp. JGI-2019a]